MPCLKILRGEFGAKIKRVDRSNSSALIIVGCGDNTKFSAYSFELDHREMVQIGVLVRVRDGDKVVDYLLCDPQIGKGLQRRNYTLPTR